MGESRSLAPIRGVTGLENDSCFGRRIRRLFFFDRVAALDAAASSAVSSASASTSLPSSVNPPANRFPRAVEGELAVDCGPGSEAEAGAPGTLGVGSPPCTASAFSRDMKALDLEGFVASQEPLRWWPGGSITTSFLENCTLLRPGAGDMGGVSMVSCICLAISGAAVEASAVARVVNTAAPSGFSGTGASAWCGSPPFR